MFCHECHDEWYRDEKGIICPECDSEFTEVVRLFRIFSPTMLFPSPCNLLITRLQIEDGNDPRDNFEHGHEDDFDDDSLPSLEEAPPNLHPLHNHNPWRDDDDDPEEADISSMRFQPTGPGRFHVQATISRTISPTQLFGGGGNELNPMGAFQSFLTNMIQGAQPQDQEHDLGGDGQSESRPAGRGMPQVHRFTYSSNGDLHPREDGRPGPRPEPVDDINR
jgi:E3 ubiquitin-protein ligase RNF115/126